MSKKNPNLQPDSFDVYISYSAQGNAGTFLIRNKEAITMQERGRINRLARKESVKNKAEIKVYGFNSKLNLIVYRRTYIQGKRIV